MIKYTVVLTVFCLSFCAAAQQNISQTEPISLYHEALSEFQNRNYGAASDLFQQYLEYPNTDYQDEAQYYLSFSQLKSGDKSAVKDIESFIVKRGSHPLAQTGYFIIGNHFFDQKNFDEALSYYLKVRKSQIPAEDLDEWYFKTGYIQLVKGDESAAIRSLDQARIYKGSYFTDASYYLGQMYYDNGRYAEALKVLEPVDQPGTEYSSKITSIVASCYFQEKNYNKLFQYADEKLTNTPNEANRTLSRLVGEAYFHQDEYRKAARFLQQHVDYSRNRTDAPLYFKLGYSYFKINEDLKAIDNFKLAGLEKGDLGQASSFYLGQLYIRSKQPDFAYSAFKSVIQSGNDAKMAEEAAFLVGKINYERRQFAESINDLQQFVKAYPSSIWSREANELLAQAYLSTSNYDQAIAHLESIPNKSNILKKSYQKVTFQKGQLLFNDSRFSQASEFFKKSVQFPMDEEIASEGYYLLGESYTQMGNDTGAIQAFNQVKKYPRSTWSLYADYGLAYVYYNQKNYRQAETLFERFTKNVSKASDYYLDGMLRLADCKFVAKKYEEAIRTYDVVKSQTANYRAYIFYQQGLCYNLMGDPVRSRIALRNVLNQEDSPYQDKALFQLAETFVEQGEFSEAVSYLDQLIKGYPNTPLAPYARARRALCYFNLDQLQGAKNDYLYILENNINHPSANAALLGLQEVIKKGVAVENFDQYMEEYQQANPDDSSLEVVAFESAKGKYYNQQYQQAITGLQEFIRKYPASGFIEDAYYFLADSYLRAEQLEQASTYFKKITEFENSAYLSRSLDKRGQALIKLGNVKEAVTVYRILERVGVTQKDVFLAQEGLMNTYFQLRDTDSTFYFANQILDSDWKPANASTTAWMIKAKTYIRVENYQMAQDELIKIINDSKNEQGAEAKYLLGKVYYLQGQNKSSLEALFDLNRNFGSYPFWVGKSFLLIADNYLAMDELLQAEATLNSIIENASINEIVTEAKQKLKSVREQEAKVLISDTVKSDTIK